MYAKYVGRRRVDKRSIRQRRKPENYAKHRGKCFSISRLFIVLFLSTMFIANIASNQVYAIVDLDTGLRTVSTVYPGNTDISSPLYNIGGTCDTGSLSVQVTLGYNFSAEISDIYVRFDLDNGATFGSNLTRSHLETSVASSISLSAGGRDDDSLVIFNITGDGALPDTTNLVLCPPSIKVVNKNPVNMRYGVYTAPVDAINQIFPLKDVTRELLRFDQSDTDNDGIVDDSDNCPSTYNPNQTDSDGDGIGDSCDTLTDTDGDGIADNIDNCPSTYNSDQTDSDNDGIGNACDVSTNIDTDGDGVIDNVDNCPFTYNPNQADANIDGVGDACSSNSCTNNTPQLVNISTRAKILGGADNPIAGFIVKGTGIQNVVVTARGKGVNMSQNLLCQDTTMTVHQYDNTTLTWQMIAGNDNWQDDSLAGFIPANLQPIDPTDAALFMSLEAGTYTAIMSCKSGTGIGLIGVNTVD